MDQSLPFAITDKTDITDIPKPVKGYKKNNIARFLLTLSFESIFLACICSSVFYFHIIFYSHCSVNTILFLSVCVYNI